MQALIITDQPLVAIGLKTALTSGLPVDQVVVDASRALEKRQAEADFELVLLDLDVRRAGRVSALQQLRRQHPGATLAALTAVPSDDEAQAARQVGASAYLPKSLPLEALSSALSSAVTTHQQKNAHRA